MQYVARCLWVGIISALLLVVQVAVAGNSLPDGNFERDKIAPWMIVTWTKGTDKATATVSGPARTGKRAAKVSFTGKQGTAALLRTFNVTGRKGFRLTVWHKTEGANTLSCTTAFRDKTKKQVASKSSPGVYTTSKTDWRKLTHVFVTPETTRSMYLYLRSGPGVVWYDDVVLEVISPEEAEREQQVSTQRKGSKTMTPQQSNAGIHPNETNLARGKPFEFSTVPTYRYTRDADDPIQLTDGEFSTEGGFWSGPNAKGTVAWRLGRPRYVSMTVDLGKVEPIKGIVFRTAGGHGGVGWPIIMDIQVSDDGRQYFSAGELVSLYKGDIPDPAERSQYRRFVYETLNLKTHGRFVRLVVVPSGLFVCCDEIEIYRGADTLLNADHGIPTEVDITPERLTRLCAAHRIRLDLQKALALVSASSLAKDAQDEAKRKARDMLNRVDESVADLDPETFRAVTPINNLHAEVFVLVAEALTAYGVQDVTLWGQEKYAPRTAFDLPTKTPPDMTLRMMRNEYRIAAFNVTNASAQARQFALDINGLPGGINPEYVLPHAGEFVDTREAVVVAGALVPMTRERDSYVCSVPAGMTRQVWLEFHPKKIPAGVYKGKVTLQEGGNTYETPLTLELADVDFPDEVDFSVGMYSYVFADNPSILRELTETTRDAAYADLRSHYMNVNIGRVAPPWPGKEAFDADGNLIAPLNYTRFDKWIKLWPNARNYFVLASVLPGGGRAEPTIGGLRRTEKGFDQRVAAWARAWAAHNRELGLKPGQVMIQFVDEPHTEDQWDALLRWSRAFKQGTEEITLFCNMTMSPAGESQKNNDMMKTYVDVLCPKRWCFTNNTKEYWAAYDSLRRAGTELWFYMCLGPVRHFDPAYYRFQPWQCLRAGATGSLFWAYSDGGKAHSWNEYIAWSDARGYTPVYLAKDSITNARHWEAVRAGIEDYQYMIMLRNEVKRLKAKAINSPLLKQAETLSDTLADEVIGQLDKRAILMAHQEWSDKVPSQHAEAGRLRILEMLERLKALYR